MTPIFTSFILRHIRKNFLIIYYIYIIKVVKTTPENPLFPYFSFFLWAIKRKEFKMAQLFYNFMADFQTESGADRHQCFQIPTISVRDDEEAVQALSEYLKHCGYIPIAIVEVSGNLSMQDLQNIQDGKNLPQNFKIKKVGEI